MTEQTQHITDPEGLHAPANSGVLITIVRIFNFRCLREVEAILGSTTVLIGENNAGKTSFLEALYAAIGSGPRQFSEDDLWTDSKETKPPKERSIIVDVLLRPVDHSCQCIDVFPAGSPWLELWGSGILQDDNEKDFVAIRTQFAWSAIKSEYVAERRFLKEWVATLSDAPKARFAEKLSPLTAAQTAPISLFLLDAKRDGAEDIRTRGSVWQKLVSEPGLADKDIEDIEARLTDINDIFVKQSNVLTHVEKHLASVGDVVNCDKDGVSITPVARRLRDLHKGMDVVLSTTGASPFPLARQGMGTRSLASVLLFRAYTSWKMSQRKAEAIHPFLAIEEPETHLHPHAQRALFGQIQSIPGQRLISTHSPYICAQADIQTFLHFGKSGSETRVHAFDSNPAVLSPEDLRRINRAVMATRGDLLFSRCIVLFEGETEEQALPAFALVHWGRHCYELGISFVGVGGKDGYTPFLRLASRFDIPWCILSDGKTSDIEAVNNCLRKSGLDECPKNTRVFPLPLGLDFEEFLAQPDYLDVLRDMIADFAAEDKAIDARTRDAYRASLQKKKATEIAEELRKKKTAYGARVAQALATLPAEKNRVPQKIQELLQCVFPMPATAITPALKVTNVG